MSSSFSTATNKKKKIKNTSKIIWSLFAFILPIWSQHIGAISKIDLKIILIYTSEDPENKDPQFANFKGSNFKLNVFNFNDF